jgi:hypothetical protein
MVDTLALAMTTAPRREVTLYRALSSLRLAGFHEEVQLFAEPETLGTGDRTGMVDTSVAVHESVSRRGCFGNWKHALKWLISHTTAPWLMIVQDDAIWRPGSADTLRAQMRGRQDPRTGLLSPYASPTNVKKDFVDGWNECRAGWDFWGALALCMKRVAAEDLLRHPRFVKHASPKQVDAVVAASMLDLNRPSFVHVPSLVDHIGDTSTINNDALTLGRRGYRFEP